jgi:hypothetical protein
VKIARHPCASSDRYLPGSRPLIHPNRIVSSKKDARARAASRLTWKQLESNHGNCVVLTIDLRFRVPTAFNYFPPSIEGSHSCLGCDRASHVGSHRHTTRLLLRSSSPPHMSTPDPPMLASPSNWTPGHGLLTPSQTDATTTDRGVLASPSRAHDHADQPRPDSPSRAPINTYDAAGAANHGGGASSIELQERQGQGYGAMHMPSGTSTARRNQVAPYAAGLASKRVIVDGTTRKKSKESGFFSGFLTNSAPIDRLPALTPPFRVAVVGAPKSGKTQIINRFITGMYDRNYVPTDKSQSATAEPKDARSCRLSRLVSQRSFFVYLSLFMFHSHQLKSV